MFSASLKHVMTGAAGDLVDSLLSTTTLLLKTVNRTGATNNNNLFIDSSNNNLAVTRVGTEMTQGNFSPYITAGYWSGYFDGSGDYLTISDHASLDLPGDFCIEFWLNAETGMTSGAGIIGHRISGGFSDGTDWVIRAQTVSGKVGFGYDIAGNWYDMGDLTYGQWVHYAVTRSGSTVRTFRNGTLITTVTNSSPWSSSANLLIGENAGNSVFYKGFMSNVRIVKGSAVYTSGFSVPTSPLTAISGTSLLCLRDNRFRDESTNNHTLTRTGDVATRAYSPFALNWDRSMGGSTSTVASNINQRLDIASTSALALGSSNFCYEAWVYPTSNVNYGTIYNDRTGGDFTGTVFSINNGVLGAISGNGGNWAIMLWSGPGDVPLNQWSHVAYTRSGSTARLFVNGVQTASTSANFGNLANNGPHRIGYDPGQGVGCFPGFISDFRLVIGSAVYTSNFTPPTSPLTNISGTALLLDFDNYAIADAAAPNVLKNYNKVTAGAVSPYVPTGYWSGFFDGSGDYLTVPDNAGWAFGTGAFCVELWVHPTEWTSSATYAPLIRTVGGTFGFALFNHSNQLTYHIPNVGDILTTTLPAVGRWSHIVLCRTSAAAGSGRVSLFVNGTRMATATNSTNQSSAALAIGGSTDWNTYVQGHISNLRIVKGNSVYDPNATTLSVPTAPLTAISGTSLLCLQDNRVTVDRSTNNSTITISGDVSSRTLSPFGANWNGALGDSIYLDGSNDYLVTPISELHRMGNGDFCVEAWLYPTVSTAAAQSIASIYGGWSLQLRNNSFMVWNGDNNLITRSYSTLNNWVHVAWTRSAGNMRIFVNGLQQGATVADSTNFINGNNFTVGNLIDGGSFFYGGYISNLRIVKGNAVYTANFTPPTSPLTAITGTTVLLSASGYGIYDATRSVNLVVNGRTQTSSAQKNYAITSVAQSSDAPYGVQAAVDLPGMRVGTGDFTAECWWRPTALAGYQTILNKGYTGAGGWVLQTLLNSGTITVFVNGSLAFNSTTPVQANVWNHVALTRSGTTLTLWVNGANAGSAVNAANFTATGRLHVGGETEGGGFYPASGNIEDVRFSRTARYTSAFTPPARALPVTAG